MPERFKVVCIPCKALYKCSALPRLLLVIEVLQWMNRDFGIKLLNETLVLKGI